VARRHSALAAFALADGDYALNEADILDPQLHQLRDFGTSFRQRLQHQPGAAVPGVGGVR
jgi:hypothetical protein